MPWVKMDDEYPDHPKVEAAGPLAAWMNVCGWAYAARYLTDGFIPDARVGRLADVPEPQALAAKLVEVGLWERADGGYMIHDYLKYNPTAEQVKAERDAARERMQAIRAKGSQGSTEAPPKRTKRSPEVRPNTPVGRTSPSPDRNPEPLPVNESNPDPVPLSEPGDARTTRGSSEPQSGRNIHEKLPVPKVSNGQVVHPGRVPYAERAPCNDDLLFRIQAIGGELDDDNTASSVTVARRLQAAAHIDDGHMANAIKDAHRRTIKRMDDSSLKPLGSPMAYFLGVLEKTTKERSPN